MKTKAGLGFGAASPVLAAGLVVLLTAGALLGGCAGGDDVEVSLPFVGNIMKKNKATEEKLASRGALVLPPKADVLPEPQDPKATPANAAGVESWPDDPDLRAKREQEVALAKQKQLERDGDWKNEQSSGNGIEDFEKKTQWSKRQTGVLDKMLND